MHRHTYIIDTRRARGLSLSTLNRRRATAGNARLAQCLAYATAAALVALAAISTISATNY